MRILQHLGASALVPAVWVMALIEPEATYALILISGVTMAALGLLLTLHATTLETQRRLLRAGTRACIFAVIVGITSIASAQLEALLGSAAGTSMGAIIGVALGGIITTYSDGITEFVTTLSRLKMRLLGTALLFLGGGISALQLTFNTVSAYFHLGIALP